MKMEVGRGEEEPRRTEGSGLASCLYFEEETWF